MTAHRQKKLEPGIIELDFEIPWSEILPHLEEAARGLSQKNPIPGFRPGRAPYLEIEKRLGQMKILETALEAIIRHFFVAAILEDQLEPIGPPEIRVLRLAPNNPLIFTAKVTLLPQILRLADYSKFSLTQKETKVSTEEVERALSDPQKMQTVETRVDRPIGSRDRVVLDLLISREKMPLEGGEAKDHIVLMDESYYIPGFTSALMGLVEGDEKNFTLNFPESHYQKNLAGRLADLRVKIKEIYQRDYPAIDDELARRLGQPSLASLKEKLRQNLEQEKIKKEADRQEAEILEKLIEGSSFEDIPTRLIQEETERMRRELERGVSSQGQEWKDYLTQIKKTEAELKLDFVPAAIRRIKTLLAVRLVAKKEKIILEEKEINEELDHLAGFYQDDPETKKRIFDQAHREQMAAALQNRKTISRLKELIEK